MKSLPTGTITFLFTDIEGSTALLQRLGDRRYAEVMEEHCGVLRAAFAKENGQEVSRHGDAFLVAFSRARDAVVAAVAGQHALAMHGWPEGASLRVRMGLHTGEPITQAGDYAGLDVHRAARICAAAHGGQILVSGTVRDLAQRNLPPGVTLRDLGTHRLKDLTEPERLLQVVNANLQADFPPLKALDTRPNNLPIQLTSFIGREREKSEIRKLLSTVRFVTLTGAGGAGKTRLALQVAAEALEEFPDGVWLVELAVLIDPTLVPKAVASALGVPEQPGRSVTETLADSLRPKSVLIVLDNCEHLVAACAHLATDLLRTCPRLRILATSREGLGVAGETTWRVPSLAVPDPQYLPSVDRFIEYESVRLFIARAIACAPQFAVTKNNAPAVAQVCYRLDGIPLAIELAAARVKVLPVEQIASRLDDQFRLLTGGSRTALPRQQTLRAAMDWSYDLLSEKERAVLRRLSVFASGWTLDAAEAVCGGDTVEAFDVLDLLAQLVDKSLVVAETHSVARYRLLETVRQYSENRLGESGETASVRKRHRDWYMNLAENTLPKLRGPEQLQCLERLGIEHENLRAALEWSKRENDAQAQLQLAGALHEFWHMSGYLSEGRKWLEAALSTGHGSPGALRARALCGAGVCAWRQGDHRARILLQESLGLFREMGDARGAGYSLHHLAHVAEQEGDDSQAAALFDESLSLFKDARDKWGISWTLMCLGQLTLHRGEPEQATALLEESLALCHQVGNAHTLSYVLHNLGTIAASRGDLERATTLLEESLVLTRRVGDKYHIPGLQYRLADVSLRHGDTERAVTLYQNSLVQRRVAEDKAGLVQCLEGLAGAAGAQGRPEQAARLFGASDALRKTFGLRRAAIDQLEHERRVASVRSGLEDSALALAWAEGGAMTLEQAIEYALSAEGN